MKQYTIQSETPLKFHKFIWYVSLPLGFLVTIGRLVEELSDMQSFSWIYAVDIGFFLIGLSLMLASFIGFFGWKSYAWYSLIIYLFVGVADNIYIFVIYTTYLPDEIGTAIGRLLGILIYTIPVGIYYKKRRPLFFQNAQSPVGTPYTTAQGVTAYYTAPQVKFCRKCGNSLESDSIFCSQCGTPVVKE